MAKPKRSKKLKRVLFAFEILIMLLGIGALYVYGQLNQKLEIIEEATPEFEEEKVYVSAEVPKMTGYTTYALFGIDHRDKNAALAGENSDTMIIASVNNDTKQVKLVSLYRDTLLDIGNGVYAKANAAYAYGGPEQAISMLNKCLDLDIKDYVTIDFKALVKAVDDLGGIDMWMSYAELVHMNNYCIETSEETDTPYTPIELPERPDNIEEIIGRYHLNGVQATSYCRIRYTASLDMGRTQRQRTVIRKIISGAKTAGLPTIFKMMDDIFPLVHTSLSSNQILQLAPAMFGYELENGSGFPLEYKFSNVKGSVIVATSLESNVVELHKLLYGEDVDYTPSATVTAISNKILDIVGGADKLDDVQIVNEADENTDNDNFIWYDDTDGSDNDDIEIPSDATGGDGDSDYTGGGDSGGDDEPFYVEPEPEPEPGSGDYEEPTYEEGGGESYDDSEFSLGEDEVFSSDSADLAESIEPE
ncbi:MAG: LCP family protein [Blautia sp.]|nr:LCP family protein [Blautia sp.]